MASMKTYITTTWSDEQASTLGVSWLKGAAQYWPEQWKTIVFGKNIYHTFHYLAHDAESPDYTSVDDLTRAIGPRRAGGREPQPCWRPKDHVAGYSYRTDARRFAWKVFALLRAADIVIKHSSDSDTKEQLLVWLDADVTTHACPPAELWNDISPAAVGWLDRPGYYPETGCLVLRLPAAVPFLIELKRRYQPEVLTTHWQWHDGWIIGEILKEMPAHRFTRVPIASVRPGDVWGTSPLAAYFDHLKGDRKQQLAAVTR